jgi:EAL domain-containing protein (putative c-di-GMP-specific phosphodiesterase class I)
VSGLHRVIGEGGSLDGQRHGVIIGVNACVTNTRVPVLRFAEADAKALYECLTDQSTGTFDSASVRLLVGNAATTVAVKTALRDAALSMSPSDVLFVYFAGHAVLTPWLRYNDPYLVTSDLEPENLRTDPDRGLRMSFLRRDVFEASSGSSFLILDTCHAGAYMDAEATRNSHRDRTTIDALEEAYEMHSPTRYGGLFACAADALAREAADLHHGILTHYALRAMRGEAANEVGEVTFDALVDYVRRQDIQPEPGTVAQGWGPATVLTRLGAKDWSGQLTPNPLPTSPTTIIEPLANPLDTHLSSLQLLLDRIFRSGHELAGGLSGNDKTARLELLRNAVDATAAAEVSLSNDQVIAAVGDFSGVEFGALYRERINKIADKKAELGYVYHKEEGALRQLIILLRRDTSSASALVLTGLAPCFECMGEPLAVVLRTLWHQPPTKDFMDLEISVLSSLRSEFGRLPLQLYRSCLDVYSRLLDSLVMVFEPVMILSSVPEMVGIHSWEALARRDITARRAPVSVLAAADTWGDRFVIERDITLAVKAITSYARAHAQGPWNHDNPKPVSINVSVRSLLSGAYERALGQAIEDVGFAPHTITLEISEGDAIEPHPDEAEDWRPTPIAFFQNRLHELARTLHINFAVDDFGVGQASLDRVSSLDLTQIKVDRAILHHSMALKELDLVVQLANETLDRGYASMPRAVVVEGFDSESPVTLRDLHARGIGYVQGYITGEPASVYLRPLSEDVRRQVAALVRGAS